MKKPSSHFIKFQISEYNNIASAHFETVKQITTFYRYYLLIISTPVFIILLLDKENYNISDLIQGRVSCIFKDLISLMLFSLFIIGFLICVYVINLRMDAILYARTVNGIRKYFYSINSINLLSENYFRVLPKNINQPRLFEIHLFLPVVLTFALINSLYLYIAAVIYYIHQIYLYHLFITIMIGLSIHVLTYRYLSYWRDNYYMRSHKIGIDIDGVLNKHRKHFCSLFKELFGKTIDPDKITVIPVHKNKSLNVSETEECAVFNDIRYWTDMPPIKEKFTEILKLSRSLGYKIYIFSRRPWPDYTLLNDEDLIEKFKSEWKNKDIKKITEEWLKKYNVYYDKLIIEKGNLDISDSTFWLFRKTFWKYIVRRRIVTKNRYQYSKKWNFRYFVDDDPVVINKISNICEYVFAMKQPYNEGEEFQQNVIKVTNWSEILDYIKKLS